MYVVYILRSRREGKLCTGYTRDLELRLREHNAGRTQSTKWRRPLEVVYVERYATEEEAKEREKYLKSGKGREEVRRLLSGAVPKW